MEIPQPAIQAMCAIHSRARTAQKCHSWPLAMAGPEPASSAAGCVLPSTSVCQIRGLKTTSADFVTRTDLTLIGPGFINAPSLLLRDNMRDKCVRLLSTQAALRLTANPQLQYNTRIVLRECVIRVVAPVMLSGIVVLDVSRMPCVGSTRKW